MYTKKLLYILILVVNILVCTACSEINSEERSSNLDVKTLDLRICLFQTSYDIYLLNNKSSTINNFDTYDKDYIIWLNKINNNLDRNMKNRLNNIFDSYSSWHYIDSLIFNQNLNSVDSIVQDLSNNNNFELDKKLKEDLSIFLKYFYNNYLDEYINTEIPFYNKKSLYFNNIIKEELLDIPKYIEKVSGISLSEKLSFEFYFTFNANYNIFIKDDRIICTINKNTIVKDLLNIALHQYSHLVFDELHKSTNLNNIHNEMKNNKTILSTYNESYKSIFTFNEWCDENLIEGFTKYLDYLYCKYDYDFSNYSYDLDFYLYLRKINFSPKKNSLSTTVFEYYKSKLEKN